ncbi:PP2C family protein-serine/threonine phosphatase [Kineococcus sp. SYSU DK003]|uniref:PP2C family protein-serine/threonine phosphatase n=1 Tax=Kineococcus sp. SYSU DK003 TaxID=3383124 RepID=UPI003D7D5C72
MGDVQVPQLLRAVEAAAPVQAVELFAFELAEQFGAEQVSFLITDLNGGQLVRLTQSRRQGPGAEDAEQVPLADPSSPPVRALTDQDVVFVEEDGGVRVLAPVSARGDAMGVLELVVPTHAVPQRRQIEDAAKALAYLVTSERRYTDLYEWGQRSRPVSLAAEIQRRLLPDAFSCDAGQFSLAGWLEPASSVGGDTFDYSLDSNSLNVSITDAMGHEVDAALLATLAVAGLRNARRAGDSLATAAGSAAEAIDERQHGFGYVTGWMAAFDLDTGRARVVNAGHPSPFLVRDGRVERLEFAPNLPLGISPALRYVEHEWKIEPGDRLLLVTDGMLERAAADVDLPALLHDHQDLHPRQLVQELSAAVRDAAGPELEDDATVLCLDWNG